MQLLQKTDQCGLTFEYLTLISPFLPRRESFLVHYTKYMSPLCKAAATAQTPYHIQDSVCQSEFSWIANHYNFSGDFATEIRDSHRPSKMQAAESFLSTN